MNYLRPYKNLINFPERVELSWCNAGMGDAIQAYRHLTGTEPDSLMALLDLEDTEAGIQAMLYGAMPGMAFEEFMRVYGVLRDQEVQDGYTYRTQWLGAVMDGRSNYMPQPKIMHGGGDPSWPEAAQPKREASEVSLLPYQMQLKRDGYSLDEIGQMTLRGAIQLYENLRGISHELPDWLLYL